MFPRIIGITKDFIGFLVGTDFAGVKKGKLFIQLYGRKGVLSL